MLSLLNNGRAIYEAARRLLAVDFRVVGLLELREKTFIATSTTTVCIFMERRSAEEVNQAAQKLVDLKSDKRAEAQTITTLESAEFDIAALRKCLNEHLKPIKGVKASTKGIKASTKVVEASYDNNLIAQALRILLDGDRTVVVAMSGDSGKEQERILGYRFSRTRGSEGLQLIEHDGMIDSMLFDTRDNEASDRISTHIRHSFLNTAAVVPTEAEKYVQVVGANAIWNPAAWTILNPSSFFITTENATSYSRYGDFIDAFECDVTLLSTWFSGGPCSLVRGANYVKEQETPRETEYRILTASNIDLATQKLSLHETRFLRSDSGLLPAMKPQLGDIILCSASGSLRHLGKIAVADTNIDGYIGGFLMLLRCADEQSRKIIEYNLLSQRFRQYIAGLKEQNISNLTVAKLNAFLIRVPKDREAFITRCRELERP